MKKLMCLFLSLVLTLGLSACGEKIDVDAHCAAVENVCAEIDESSVLFAGYGSYIMSYWQALNKIAGVSSFEAEDAIESANEWILENSGKTREEMDATYSEICSKAEELLSVETKNETVLEVNNILEQYYKEYCAFHSIVTNPDGTVKQYVTALRDHTVALTELNENLTNLLKSEQE